MYKDFWSSLMRTTFAILLPLASLIFGGVANAVTIDFDDIDATYFGLSTYQEDGFTLNSNVPDGTIIDVNNVVRGNLGIFGGGTDSQTMVWGENGTISTISVTNDAATPFYLLALDASSMGNASGQLTLTGTLSGGGTVQQVLNLNSALTTFNITGMNNLSGLDISFDGATYFAPFDLDNVQMSIVPIPAAIWMLGSALIGLAGWARRRTIVS
jgi:hypothetical protein